MNLIEALNSDDIQVFSLYCNIVWKEQGEKELFNLLLKNNLSQNRGYKIENNKLWVYIEKKYDDKTIRTIEF